jgi:hypothetical protein
VDATAAEATVATTMEDAADVADTAIDDLTKLSFIHVSTNT